MKNYILLFNALFFIASCQIINKEKERTLDINKSDTHVRKKYNDDGILITEVPYKGDIKHGIAKHYYTNGNVSMEIPYVYNQKNGISKYYYTDGSIYRTTPYKDGKIEGLRKLYYQSGKLMAEIPYRKGAPIPGLKEWTEDGDLLTKYPEITFQEIDKLNSDNLVILKIYFSDKSKNVEFFRKEINSHKDTTRIPLIAENGMVNLEFYIPKGKIVEEEIEIVGIKKTRRRSLFVAEETYRLKIKNE